MRRHEDLWVAAQVREYLRSSSGQSECECIELVEDWSVVKRRNKWFLLMKIEIENCLLQAVVVLNEMPCRNQLSPEAV